PDIVLHDGHPLFVQKVFDFKFPCKSRGTPEWRRYPPGHPYYGKTQGGVYKEVLKADADIISPQGNP
ncbi:MAG: hypothetical protein JXB05_02975, partial [Myxococcaceae bacterium]|nr:hypothetical protein [Myxococcaceae bacterium]